MEAEKRWVIFRSKPQLVCSISRELNISPVTAKLLVNRGIDTVDAARRFFNYKIEDLSSPWQLDGIAKAVQRIIEAKDKQEKVTVYGDYDVDGLTGTALLFEALQKLEIDSTYYIPHRLEEGYGLNKEALKSISENGSRLIISVDCGITSIKEVEYAQNELNVDMIITDHHTPLNVIPPAVAVINPKLGGESPFYYLAGVGVAFKLVQALWEKSCFCPYQVFNDFLDLVVLGTIADIVKLTAENRILVKNGLKEIRNTRREGLKALMDVSEIDPSSINTRSIGFGFAPRLNAAGRIGDASVGVELLTTTSAQKARELARYLENENKKRQIIEKNIFLEAEGIIEDKFDFSKEKIIVLASDLWHPGVVGIVASRLVEKYYRPVIIFAIEGSIGKGSARSVPGFNIYNAIAASSSCLLQFGGHEMAAGLTIKSDKIADFRKQINDYARLELSDDVLTPVIAVDDEIFFHELSNELVEQIKSLEPFGEGNPAPLLAYRGAEVIGYRIVGKDKNHLKMELQAEGRKLDAIGFDLQAKAEIAAAGKIDVAFSLEENTWQGKTNLQLKIEDIRLAGQNQLLGYNDEAISIDEFFYDVVNAARNGQKIIVTAYSHGLLGSCFSAYHMLLSELGIPHQLLKYSCEKSQMQKIIDEFILTSGIIFADLYTLKSLQDRSFLENSDKIFLLKSDSNKLCEISGTLRDLLEKNDSFISNYRVMLAQPADILSDYGKKTVIYCSTKKDVVTFAQNIWANSKVKTIYCHPWMSTSQQKLALEMFNQGLVKFIITTPTINLDKIDCERVFFNNLPLDNAHFQYLLTESKAKTLEIYVAESAEFTTKMLLDAMFPQKKILSQIYLYFTKKSMSDIKGCLNFLRSNICPRANRETINIAKAIFEDLGVVQNLSSKVELISSWRYQGIVKQHEGFQKLLQSLYFEKNA